MRVPSLDRVTAVLAPLVTLLVTFLVIVVTLLVVRPPVPSSAQGFPPDAGVRRELRIGAPGVPSVLDPGAALEGTVPLIARQVFDTLVVWREGSTEIDPALATRWTASRDGLVWSFTLREGVKFHDGTPLTSTEVGASFERRLQPETQGAGRAWPALLRGAPGVVKEFRTPSPRTVQIVLSQPYSPLLTVLAHPGFGVAKLSTAADGTGRLVGTGPYRIVDASGGRLALEAISGHWAGQPRSDRLVFLEVSTDDQAEAEIDSRSLDIWFPAGPPRRSDGALSTPGLRLGYLAFQTEKEPFSRQPLRQAVAAATVLGGDPHLLLFPLSTSEGGTKGPRSLNFSFSRNPRLDDVLIRASQLSLRSERQRLYQRAQALLADDLPWIPIYVRLHWAVARAEVRGLRLHPTGFHRLDTVSLDLAR